MKRYLTVHSGRTSVFKQLPGTDAKFKYSLILVVVNEVKMIRGIVYYDFIRVDFGH